MMKALLIVLILMANMVILPNAMAEEKIYHVAKVTAIINDTEKYSGCMLRLEPTFQGLSSCPRKDFVSLDCDGQVINSRASASQLLNAAQLSFVADLNVRLRITENTVDGFCIADYVRIDKPKD